ncbi:MAG: hypothetical protein ACOX3W_00575 [Christensenellaceae bacterium]|jgi:hypothetical protein
MKKDFPKGVSWYTEAEVTVKVYFPEDSVCCYFCKFCRGDGVRDRHKCFLTNEILLTVDMVGRECPLIVEEVREDE